MNRRHFLRGWGAAIAGGIVMPTYFLAPSGGWPERYNNPLLTPQAMQEMLGEYLASLHHQLDDWYDLHVVGGHFLKISYDDGLVSAKRIAPESIWKFGSHHAI
jgi:hypothetical protein